MDHQLALARRLLVLLALAVIVSPTLILAEESVSARLRQQATMLQQDIEVLKKSKADLASRVSVSLLSSLESEIKTKEAALESIQGNIKQAEALEQDIGDLASMRDKMQGHISTELLSKVGQEITDKRKVLAKLPGSSAISGPNSVSEVDPVVLPAQTASPALPAASSGQEARAKPSATPPVRTVEGCILNPLETLNGDPNVQLTSKCVSYSSQKDGDVSIMLRPTSRSSSSNASSCSSYNFLGDCTVKLTRGGETIAEGQTNTDGYFHITYTEQSGSGKDGNLQATTDAAPNPKTINGNTTPPPLMLSTEADNYWLQREIKLSDNQSTYRIDLPLENRPVSLMSRAIVGLDQSGATSVKAAQKFFFDLFVSEPFPWQSKRHCEKRTGRGCIDPDFGPRVRVWGDAQVSSVPQDSTTPLATFVTGEGFAGQAAKLQLGQIAQSVQMLAGGEFRLKAVTFRTLLPSFDHNTKQKLSLSVIAAFGGTTPTNPIDSAQLFKIPQGATSLPGLSSIPASAQYVAYVSSARDRFFRQYYAGFRFQTFFFNRFDRPLQRFPAMLDVMYGQNEYITRGHFRGGLFRVDGYFPLPYEGLKFINLFATGYLRPTRAIDISPLVLQSATGITFPSPNVVVVTAPQLNRDYYRVGVGIDFVSFAQLIAKKAQPLPQNPGNQSK